MTRRLLGPSLVLACLVALGSTAGGQAGGEGKHRLKIELDYRFAGDFFADPDRRRALEAAANLWSDVLTSDFPELPKETKLEVWHPVKERYEPVTLDHAIDDVVVFVFAFPMAGAKKARGSPFGAWVRGDALDRRYNGQRFQPWAGWIHVNSAPERPWFFDPTPETSDDLPVATHCDFISTAVHELGHALGFVASVIDAHKLADEKDRFLGPRATARSGGRPVLLDEDHGHLSLDFTSGIARPNVEVHAMAGRDRLQGFRTYPHALDLAVFEDLGYEVDPSRLRVDPFFGKKVHPDEAAYHAKHPSARTDPRFPVGLWHVASREHASSAAVLGYPLKYRGATLPGTSAVARLEQVDGAVRVPKGSSFVATYDLAPSPSGGGKAVNRFSLVFDVRLPRLGEWYPLYNCSTANAGDAEAYIDPAGRVGKGKYSTATLRPGAWYRIVVTVDNASNEQLFYVDGKLVTTASTSGIDGSNSLGVLPAYNQWIHLFGDGGGYDAPIDVRRVALFGYPLGAADVEKLGDATRDIAM